MNVADFNVGKAYLVRQRGYPANGEHPATSPEIMVIEVLQPVAMDSASFYQSGRFFPADAEQLKQRQQFVRAVKRSHRRVFLIEPGTIETAVLLKD